MLRARQAAALLNVDDVTVRRWIKRGLIPAVKIGGQTLLIPSTAIDRLARSAMAAKPAAVRAGKPDPIKAARHRRRAVVATIEK